jgi:hypothetical protein
LLSGLSDLFLFVVNHSQKREEYEVIEYEPPRSVSPSPPPSPMRLQHAASNGHLSTGPAPAAPAAAASAPAQPSNISSGASVGSTGSTPNNPAAAPATPAPAVPAAVVTPVAAHNVHASVNLLDWDDAPAAPAAPKITLIECAGRFTPVLFQQLWGKLAEAYAGQICTLVRRPGSTAEVEAALRTQKVRSFHHAHAFRVHRSAWLLPSYICLHLHF